MFRARDGHIEQALFFVFTPFCEDPATVLQAFKDFSKNAIIVGHNVNYDVTIFTNELSRHNLGNPEFKAIYDTLDIYRRFYPNLPNHTKKTQLKPSK